MVKIENTFMIGVMLLIIVFGFVGTSTSANDTNATNTSQDAYVTMDSSAVTPMDDQTPPTPSDNGIDPAVSISITPSVDLSRVVADGSEHYYASVTQVNLSASEWNYQFTPGFPAYGPSYADDTLNLYVNATGDFVSSSDRIPLNNLQYKFSNSSLPKTSFKTNCNKVNTWNIPYSGVDLLHWKNLRPKCYYSLSTSVTGDYYLTVPTGVSSGTYHTTVCYLAILQ